MSGILKISVKSLILHFCIQLAVLVQIKIYDSYPGIFSDSILIILPIIIGIATYCLMKTTSGKVLLRSVVTVLVLIAVFAALHFLFDYFSIILNLVIDYDATYYEAGINAMICGGLSMISAMMAFATIKLRCVRTK